MTKEKTNIEKRGRKTLYKPEYCDLKPYLKSCKTKRELPSICGYAVYLEVCEQTVMNWGKKHEEFFGSLRRLLTISKQTLMNKGLKGTYNATIAKLILSSDHGMKERNDTTSGDVPIHPMSLDIPAIKKLIADSEKAGNGIDKKSIEGENGNSD